MRSLKSCITDFLDVSPVSPGKDNDKVAERVSPQSILAFDFYVDSSLDMAINVMLKDADVEDALDEELNLDQYAESSLPKTKEGLKEQLKILASQEILLKKKIKAAVGQTKNATILVKYYQIKKRKMKELQNKLDTKKNDINKLLKAFKEKNNTSELEKNPGKKKRKKRPKPSKASTCSSEKRMKKDDSSGCSQLASSDGNIPNTTLCDASDEVVVLPVPTKPDPPLIILDEEASTDEVNSEDARLENNNKSASSVSDFFKKCNQTCCLIHCGPVIKIEIFDDFLYTCSNDGTAKRIDLKDYSKVVCYRIEKKNGLIKNIAVEKVQNETVVCALTTKNLVVMLYASNSNTIATFSEPCSVMALCKGWGKFYAGWSDGTIHIYSWTVEKEAVRRELCEPKKKIVKTYQSIRSLATTNEGNLPFLLLLTTGGKIIIRGAETAVYIRSIDIDVFGQSIFAVHQNYVYFCSKVNVLSVFSFLTKKADNNIQVEKRVVGIAFSGKYVFTIMDKSNIVTCYNLDKLSEGKLTCEVVECGHLTSIYVHEDWVILGNNKGKVIAFKFYIQESFSCKFGNCTLNFDSMNALLYHLKYDHVNNSRSCQWMNCGEIYNVVKLKQKMPHMEKHFKEIPCFTFG